MPASFLRMRRALSVCLLTLAAIAAPTLSITTARGGSVPYGAVEVFGSNWAGAYATWGDLNVYSNADGTQDRLSAYGLQYECVELVQRWAGIRFGEQPIWGGNADQLWAIGPNLRVPLTQHPNGGDVPQFGDIMVFDQSAGSPFGHVAVVAGVGGGYVLLAEQNWASSGLNRVAMDSPTHVPDRSGLPVIGWLRGPASSTPPPPPLNVSGAAVATGRRVAVVAGDGRLWTSTSSGGSLVSVGNALAGSPALLAEPPTSSLGRGLVHYLGVNSDSHQLYSRSDATWWVLASTAARCLDGPAAVLSAVPGGFTVTVACEGTDHAVWVTSAPMSGGGDLLLNGPWVRWGGVTASGPAIAVIGGQPMVIVSGTDHQLWARSPASSWSPIAPGMSCNAHPTTAVSGRLTWLGCQRAGDGALLYTSGVDGVWATPRSAGGVVVDGPGLSATPAGAIVDVRGTDGSIWEATLSVTVAASVWTNQGWQAGFGPSGVALATLPIAVASAGTDSSLEADTPGSPPVSLGGSLAAAPALVSLPAPDPAAPATALYIAVFPDQTLRARTAAGTWQPLGAPGSPSCIGGPAAQVRATAAGLVLTAACEGADRALWYASGPVPPIGLPTLSGWRSLGGVLSAGPAVGMIGGVETFVAVGARQQLYWATASRGWSSIPGWMCSGRPALASAPAVSYLACQGTDQAMWWAPSTGGGLSAPRSEGGVVVDGPSVAAWNDQAIAFVNGTDGSVWQRRIAVGGTSQGWLQLPGSTAVGGVAATAL